MTKVTPVFFIFPGLIHIIYTQICSPEHKINIGTVYFFHINHVHTRICK